MWGEYQKTEDQGGLDILFQTNLMNRRLEVRKVSDNFAYCLDRLGDPARTARRRRLDPGKLFDNKKRHHQETAHEEQREIKKGDRNERSRTWNESEVTGVGPYIGYEIKG
ncbi:unnamed protein product [Protopolystoma xenopodis]|uniref:Uncharacterized protein n=1 Tax=Protopolystoma xenopodis TaxID=117903 RepID=A0A3S5AFS0_9PLAT|nr:unnamed protein product [Protopolystoma xenopodis]